MKRFSKKKILLVVALVLVLALLGYAVAYAVTSNQDTLTLNNDSVAKVERGNITSVFSSTATVASGKQGTFQILDGTKVVSVEVRVGDTVKAGDLLATFDTSSLNNMLKEKKSDYEEARKNYQSYVKSLEDAPKQEKDRKAKIAELEKKIAELENKESSTDDTQSAPQNSQLDSIKESVTALLGNTRLAGRIVDAVFAENGSVANTITAFQNLLGGSMLFDTSALESMMGSMNSESMSLSMELIQLKLQDSLSGITSGMSLDSVYKSLAESSEAAYLQAEQTAAQLKKGWYAEYDGIIREVNITEGEVYYSGQDESSASAGIDVTSLLASLAGGNADIGSLLGGLFSNQVSGLVAEYYPFTASFVLGKYDIAKVALDQSVKVTSVSGQEFDAYVSFISPVAQDSSDINISSLLGSSGSSKGVEARITIPNPDKSITIGLDVDITIDLETKENVLRIPVEAVAFDDETGRYYVFILERVSRTIRRQDVSTGLFDGNTYYEIVDGLHEGDEIVRAPQKSMVDGQRVKLG